MPLGKQVLHDLKVKTEHDPRLDQHLLLFSSIVYGQRDNKKATVYTETNIPQSELEPLWSIMSVTTLFIIGVALALSSWLVLLPIAPLWFFGVLNIRYLATRKIRASKEVVVERLTTFPQNDYVYPKVMGQYIETYKIKREN